MTTMMNEQFERRISEHLDGRLDDSQQTELLRELMRDPQARRTHDAWAENDRDAAAALRAVVDLPARPFVVKPKRKRQIPWAQLLATAALIVMAGGVWVLVDQLNTIDANDAAQQASGLVAETTTPAATQDPASPERIAMRIMNESANDKSVDRWWRSDASPIQDGKLVDAVAAPRVVDTQTAQNARQVSDRSLLGIIDKTTDRSYWLEMHSEQTVIHAVGGEM